MTHIWDVPLEVLFLIFEFLAPLPEPGVGIKTHPLLALRLVSRQFHDSLIPFLRIQIRKCTAKSLQKYQSAPEANAFRVTHKLLKLWLNATLRHCFGCGNLSNRRAIMDSTLVCCSKCDRIKFPLKITMSEAMKKYSLKKEELFGGVLPPSLGGQPEASRTEDDIIPQRKGLHFGQYTQLNTITTMFYERDVRAFACRKHGIDDIDEYLLLKSDKSDLRRAKVEENREKRRSYIRRLAQKNELDPDAFHYLFHIAYTKSGKQVTPPHYIRTILLLQKLGLVYDASGTTSILAFEIFPIADSGSKCFRLIKLLKNIRNRFHSMYHEDESTWWGEHFRYQRLVRVIKSNDPKRQGAYDFYDDLVERDRALITHFLHDDDSDSDDNDIGLIRHPTPGLLIDSEDIPNIPIWGTETEEFKQSVFHRKFDTSLSYIYNQYGAMRSVFLLEFADPIDYCLFEAFIEEFGVEGVEPPKLSYAELRDIWRFRDIAGDPESGFKYSEEKKPFNTPWSWTNYPIYVEDVTAENYFNLPPSQGPSGAPHQQLPGTEKAKAQEKKEQDKLARRNQNAKRYVERMTEVIKSVVAKHGWDLLAEDGGRAWEIAIQDALVGKGKGVSRAGTAASKTRASGKASRSSKGKEVAN